MELKFAGDALERKVSLLDPLSGFYYHVVVVVIYATPEFVRLIGLRLLLAHLLIGKFIIIVGTNQAIVKRVIKNINKNTRNI